LTFQAVFFDMDGLFLDSEPQWHEAETLMMRVNGYDWRPEDQLHCLGGPLSRVAEYMSNCLDQRKSPHELEAMIISEMTDRLSRKVPLMPGALAISRAIHQSGVKQGLVSASPRPIVDGVLHGMREKYFDVTVGAGDIERTKPFPDPYLHAARLLDVDITQSLIFEDSPTGITAAVASGAFVVAVPHYVEVQEKPRLKVISSFEDITISDLENWSEINQRELGRSS
jgi:HAD superfamily hydrolase (TIGR01509 family)